MNRIPHVATIVGAVVFFAIGALWYNVLQAPWLAGVGKTMEQLTAEQGSSPMPYVVGFAAILVMCYLLAWLIARTGTQGAAAGAGLGVALALGLVGGMLALNYGFESRPVSLWLINAGYAVVGLGIAGGIIAGWKRRSAGKAVA